MIEIEISSPVKIGGLDYSIESDTESDKYLRSIQAFGAHNAWLQWIKLRTDLTPQGFSQAFIHEVLEAGNNTYLNNKLDDSSIDPLASALTQVMEQLGIRFVKN